MTNGIGPWAHGARSRPPRADRVVRGRRFPDSDGPTCRRTAGALAPRTSLSRRRHRRHVELLLMPQQQISPRKTSRAFRAFKRLFFGV